MKKFILFSLIVSLVLISCSSEQVNTVPTVPNLISPSNNKLCINNSISFEWSVATDAEKNPIVYQLQIATDNQFTQIVSNTDVSSTVQTMTLDKGKAYYWRVKAIDDKKASSEYSSTFSFYTEGIAVTNHAPFLPQLVSPTNNSSISGLSTALKWTASDVDLNDVLSFDVYLGTENNPSTKIVDNKASTTFDATLQANKKYYWKVVVRDNKGTETNGQIWSFRTN